MPGVRLVTMKSASKREWTRRFVVSPQKIHVTSRAPLTNVKSVTLLISLPTRYSFT